MLNNRPQSGNHSILVVLYRCIVHQKGTTRDRLLDLCAPENASKRSDVENTLRKWEKLGLFTETEGKIEIISPPCDDVSTSVIRRHALEVVMAEHNNTDLFEEGDGNAVLAQDFTRAVAWFLAQDAYDLDALSNNVKAGAKEASQFEPKDGRRTLNLENNTRWTGFVAWVRFLGFGWHDGKSLVPDPSLAIQNMLPKVFAAEEKLDVGTFLQRLSTHVPVLDGGHYRRTVEKALTTNWEPPKKDQISTSLSRSLRRLDLQGTIELEFQSDADARELLGPNGQPFQLPRTPGGTVTHIGYTGVK
jgi:hypothetical protein